MDEKLARDIIELLNWVKQWYYTLEHVKRFDDMIARLEAAQQSVQADGACTCAKPSWVHDDGNTFYCSLCGKSPRR